MITLTRSSERIYNPMRYSALTFYTVHIKKDQSSKMEKKTNSSAYFSCVFYWSLCSIADTNIFNFRSFDNKKEVYGPDSSARSTLGCTNTSTLSCRCKGLRYFLQLWKILPLRGTALLSTAVEDFAAARECVTFYSTAVGNCFTGGDWSGSRSRRSRHSSQTSLAQSCFFLWCDLLLTGSHHLP